MKKILLLMMAVTLVFTSCSKEGKLNRKLKGDWNVESIAGMSLSSLGMTSITLSFDKDKKDNGSFTFTQVSSTGTETEKGKYTLKDDTLITIVYDDGTTDVMTITDYSKKDLTLTQDGYAIVCKKK